MRALLILSSLCLPACGGDTGIFASEDKFEEYDEGGDGGGAWDTGDAGFDGGDGEPEEEESFEALKPASTPAYVFVANALRGTVTRISTADLSVVTTEVGVEPLTVQTTPDLSLAVTLNAGTNDLSLIDADTLQVVNVAIRDNLNTLAISPDGRWALAYHDVDVESTGTESGGAQSFTEVSVVNLETHEHFARVVGFKPHDLQFTEDGSRALVVSDAYLGLMDLDLAEPEVTRISISDDAVDPPAAEEVLLAPDGSYALVRQFGSTTLLVVDLATELVENVPVGILPTDLDLTPDGLSAVAVARGSSELWVYDLADPTAEAKVVTLPGAYTFGSITMSPDGKRGLLYSTASGEGIYAVWDRETDDVVVYGLVKPVQSVTMSPDGGVALVFHPKENGVDTDKDGPFSNAWAMTMIALDEGFPNPLLLAGEPITFASSEDSAWGFLIMEGVESVVAIEFAQLLDHEVALKSPPEWAGVMPGGHMAYISQTHDLGRISFFDPDEMTVQTVTGFELNSQIEVH